MTSGQWGTLVPAIASFLLAGAAWLRAQAAHKRIDQNHPDTKK